MCNKLFKWTILKIWSELNTKRKSKSKGTRYTEESIKKRKMKNE